MLSTTCLSSLIYPWLLTCLLWCWAPRLTVTQTTSSSGKITAISPSKHIVFWTGREITVVVHMDDFGLLLGTIKTQFVEGPSIECRRAKVKEIENGQSERKKISMSQWELKFRTSQLSEPRENTVGQIAFGFSFEWDWFGKWCEFSVPIIETQTIPDDFRHSIENCSVILH